MRALCFSSCYFICCLPVTPCISNCLDSLLSYHAFFSYNFYLYTYRYYQYLYYSFTPSFNHVNIFLSSFFFSFTLLGFLFFYYFYLSSFIFLIPSQYPFAFFAFSRSHPNSFLSLFSTSPFPRDQCTAKHDHLFLGLCVSDDA